MGKIVLFMILLGILFSVSVNALSFCGIAAKQYGLYEPFLSILPENNELCNWAADAYPQGGTYTVWGINFDPLIGRSKSWTCCNSDGTCVSCSASRPVNYEICDDLDNDNDGLMDEGCDDDQDGFADSSMLCVNSFQSAKLSPYMSQSCEFMGGDCNDNDPNISPAIYYFGSPDWRARLLTKSETCSNNIDDNCNGQIDEGCTFSLSVSKTGTGSGTVSGTGISCGTDCSEPYNSGTLVTLTPYTATGSSFTGWTGACSGTSTCSVTMDSVKSVTATFNLIIYSLSISKSNAAGATVTSIPAGINCGLTCPSMSANFNYGTSVVLTGTLSPGYSITGITGCDSTSGTTCTVLMNSARSVIATLGQLSCNLSSPSGAGIILYPGTPTQSNQNWIYDDTSPYSSCSWRCNSSNNYIRDGNSCIQCLASETNLCANGINDDCLNGWDYDIQTWSNGAAIGSPYHTQGDPNCKVGIILGTITGGISP